MPISVPSWFVTLSPADVFWPELFKAVFPRMTSEDLWLLSPSVRYKVLGDYPDYAAQLFYYRWQSFFKHILNGKALPLGHIVDFFIRIEFQMRGSPHVHFLLWVLEAANALKMQETPEGLQQLADMTDKFIKCWILPVDIDTDALSMHASKDWCPHEVLSSTASQRALGRSVSYSQMHSAKCTSSCFKYCKPSEQQVCRFGYPKNLQDTTAIEVTRTRSRVEMKVMTKRNHPRVNNYNPTLLRAWNGNMDVQFCGNPHGAAVYVCNYATKVESDTLAFKKEFRQRLLRQNDQDTTLYKQFYALAMSSTKAREVSAQEATWILLGYPLVKFSREVIDVVVSPISSRIHTLPSQRRADNMTDDATDWEPKDNPKTAKGMKVLYGLRPTTAEWEGMSLHAFITQWTWVAKQATTQAAGQFVALQNNAGFVRPCDRVAIINAIPHITLDFTNEDSCNSIMILHVPWHAEEDWRSSFPTACKAVAAKRATMPPHIIAHLDRVQGVEAVQQQVRDDLQAGIHVSHHDTAPAPATSPIDSSVTEAEQDMVPAEAQVVDFRFGNGEFQPRQNYAAEEIARAKGFLEQQKAQHRMQQQLSNAALGALATANLTGQADEDAALAAMISKLNSEQRFAFDIVRHHMLRDDTPERKQLRMFVSGPGGTGKSFLIDAVRIFVRQHFGNTGGRYGPVVVMAPTGAAAVNVKGTTIHSTMHYGKGQGRKDANDLSDKRRASLHKDFGDCAKLFVIDEVSMFGGLDVIKLNMHMQAAFPERSSEPFGGAHIIFFGDFYQLKPVGRKPLYDISDELERSLWIRPEDVCVFLTQQMRHATTNNGIDFGDINCRARTGEVTDADLQLLNTRALLDPARVSYSLADFANKIPIGTPIGVFTNKEAEDINNSKLRAQRAPIISIWARHSFAGGSSSTLRSQRACLESAENLKLEPVVRLSVGSPTMLLGNLATELGLVNGSIGTVYDVIYNTHSNEGTINPQATLEEACNASPMLAIPIVLVHFPSYIGASFVPGLPKVVPVIATREPNATNTWSRSQLPLRPAYAMTIHKLQGMTLAKLALDLTKATQRGLAYVGISRVKTLDGLLLRNTITRRNFTCAAQGQGDSAMHKDFHFISKEYQRLNQVYQATIATYANKFNNNNGDSDVNNNDNNNNNGDGNLNNNNNNNHRHNDNIINNNISNGSGNVNNNNRGGSSINGSGNINNNNRGGSSINNDNVINNNNTTSYDTNSNINNSTINDNNTNNNNINNNNNNINSNTINNNSGGSINNNTINNNTINNSRSSTNNSRGSTNNSRGSTNNSHGTYNRHGNNNVNSNPRGNYISNNSINKGDNSNKQSNNNAANNSKKGNNTSQACTVTTDSYLPTHNCVCGATSTNTTSPSQATSVDTAVTTITVVTTVRTSSKDPVNVVVDITQPPR